MNALDEDWRILVSMLPPSWQRTARLSGAVERLRGFDSVNEVLHVLLMHVGCGYSLRETAVRAKAAGLAEISDVTLLNRLRQAEGWLQHLCQALLEESGVRWRAPQPRRHLRALDGTVIKEPGPTGSHWRLHYSLRLPELTCDQLVITATKGAQTAENLERFPMAPGDIILADRGYCHPSGVARVSRQGADIIVRLNSSVPLFDPAEQRFPLLGELRTLPTAGSLGQWRVGMHDQDQRVEGRLCAVRKSQQAIAAAQRKLDQREHKHQIRVRPETREYAHYVMVFTTLPESEMGAAQVLEYYRFRWQIELVFKRLKSLLVVGHLPKHDAQSARAWLYGKLFVALLTQKLVHLGSAISPWGYDLGPGPEGQSLA
jgi:Transposase DDE domain